MAMRAFSIGLVVLKNLPWYSFKALALAIVVVIYWCISIGSVLLMFSYFLISYIATEFVIAFGPIFIAMYFFPAARMFFNGWLRVAMAGVLTQIFVVGLLSLFLSVLTTTITQVTAGFDGGQAGTVSGAIRGGNFAHPIRRNPLLDLSF